jgi:hypothetical protein
VSQCANCGHKLGLKRPVWWWSIKFCCLACRTLYKARWRYDLRRRTRSVIRRLPAHQLRRGVIRASLLVSVACFLVLGGPVLLDQWISGDKSPLFMFSTTTLIVGGCIGLFAAIAGLGLMISALFHDERATER